MAKKDGSAIGIMSGIRGIIFDLDDTLFDITELVHQARREACKAMIDAGLPSQSIEKTYSTLRHIVHLRGSNYADHFGQLCRAYGTRPNPRIIAAGRVAYHNVKMSQLTLYPKTRELLTSLVKQGTLLALVTRGIPLKQWEKILRLELAEFFDTILVVDAGRNKRKRDAYEHVLKRWAKQRANKQNIMCVGNKLDDDIAEANRLGLVSVRVLQGKHKRDVPKNKIQEARYSLQKVSDLGRLLKKISVA